MAANEKSKGGIEKTLKKYSVFFYAYITLKGRTMIYVGIGSTADRLTETKASPIQSEYEQFYIAYGECLAAWTIVETNLLATYIRILAAPEYKVASAVFYSTTGFRAKLDMVNAAITNSSLVSAEKLKQWAILHKHCGGQTKHRNALAHHTVYFGRLTEHGERKMFIAHSRTPGEGQQRDTTELKKIKQSFIKLFGDLFSFWNSLPVVSDPNK